MKIYDVSAMIHNGMAVYKNREEKRPQIRVNRDYSKSTVYESAINMDLHTGTHLDAPLHCVEGGDTLDGLDLQKVITRCSVLDMTEVQDHIDEGILRRHPIHKGDFILFKTRNSFTDEFDPEFIYLDKTGADYLRSCSILGVGTDGMGIERAQPGHETHKTLFKAGILILEGLQLKEVEAGEYTLIALPLKIAGVEAAPVRAVLISQESKPI